ncbi:MAG TPA: SPOR domain-containing protein [Burkholderiales bacterium]|nr:SPOR domain-containing protein [Burkholderiales bacterium]
MLVVAIVVVLPMVLDSEPGPGGQTVSVQIPSSTSGVFASKVVPLAPAPESKAGPGRTLVAPAAEESKMITAAPPVSPPPVPVKEAVQESPNDAVKQVPQPAAAKPRTKPVATPDGKYVVQVIALADAGKAKQMQERITDAGIKSYTEVVKTSKGDVTRVRAGPFATRGAAEKAREQLKILGMNGNIIAR